MSTLHFEWDDRKAAANLRKHGVSFDEAKSAFADERAKLMPRNQDLIRRGIYA
ncbi:MAG: BrnT family toxin [Pseudomonadota bacterium]